MTVEIGCATVALLHMTVLNKLFEFKFEFKAHLIYIFLLTVRRYFDLFEHVEKVILPAYILLDSNSRTLRNLMPHQSKW